MSAIILKDAYVTLKAMGGDDGTSGPAVGNAASICVNKVEVSQTRDLVDASCEQSDYRSMRIRKLDWEIKIETILEKGGTFLESLQSGNSVLVEVVITADGATVSGTGIISEISWSYDNPSTLSLTIQPYGTGLTVTKTTGGGS